MGEAKRRRDQGVTEPRPKRTNEWLTVSYVNRDTGPATDTPNPAYPHGINLDMTAGEPVQSCMARIPYPAQGVGVMVVKCSRCGTAVGASVAGRADDPCTLRIACKEQAGATGRFPAGISKRPGDQGELGIAVSAPDSDGNVYIDFGKPVEWISLPQRQVVEMCLTMLNKVGVQVNIEVRHEEKPNGEQVN